MKSLTIALSLLAVSLLVGNAQAGIFGRRSNQSATANQSQPASGYRSYSHQPSSQFPFNSRSKPDDWHEMHRGYGVKIRGW